MMETYLRRKDTTKGPPLRILSLDGGGVRGYSMLILLQELMHRTFVEVEGRAPRRDEIPRPCEHFDLIAGTGTGGLIALMLGRLRMDLETCKDVYVRMTRRVFETDKTIVGIPYRSTLFKASKLEEAIRECVREADEPGLGREPPGSRSSYAASPLSPTTPMSAGGMSRASSVSGVSRYGRFGNPNAPLYDSRENRTKTAVTAVFRGTPRNGNSVLLRSYDSRKEPPPEFDCTIWQSGRATCATGLAFKPIQVGQSVFIDEGAGKYNPAPQILDEAAINEWPGRDVGVFMSIGTGKRPHGTNHQQHEWWEGFVGSGMGDFAEARRRLMSKIEGCEDTHLYMLREHLGQRGVNTENYYRLNVEVGVGEFGMNEWNRLADISTNTRRYLAKPEVQTINMDAASKLGRIHRAIHRHSRLEPIEASNPGYEVPPPANPLAVELPTPDQPRPSMQSQRTSLKVYSDEYPQPLDSAVETPISAVSPATHPGGSSPPPLPPKTPIQQSPASAGGYVSPSSGNQGNVKLPYPEADGPPPVVNFARKPEYTAR